MNKINVLIVDDHAVLRMGLASLLKSKPSIGNVDGAASGAEALRLYPKLNPDVVIMDMMMPQMDGTETTRRLIAKHPEANILILTSCDTSDRIAHCLEAGAHGAIMKSAPFDEIVAAIESVAAGRRSVSSEVESILEQDPPIPALTDRQLHILASVTRGLSNTDISRELGLDPTTVRDHLSVIFKKLGVANRAEAAAIALRKQLLKM